MTDLPTPETFPDEIRYLYEHQSERETISRQIFLINHLSTLVLLLDYFPSQQDPKLLAYLFIFIKKIMQKKGILLEVEQLQNQIAHFIQYMAENAQLLSSSDVCIGFSDAVGYTYRFLFEKTLSNPAPFLELFQLFESDSEQIKIVCLSIMKSVLFALKDSTLSYTYDHNQKRNAEYFKETYYSSYFQVAAKTLLENSPKLIDPSLNLLEQCFTFYANQTNSDKELNYRFNAPMDVIHYYQSGNHQLPDALLTLFETSTPGSERERLAVELLIYFASASENIWGNPRTSPMSFLLFTSAKLTQLIQSQRCQKTENTLHLTSRLIYKLGTFKIPAVRFMAENQEVAVNFFLAVSTLTEFSFHKYLMESASNYFLKFWGELCFVHSNLTSMPADFVRIFPHVFTNYIESLKNYDESQESTVDGMQTYIESMKYLWCIALADSPTCVQCITSALESSTAFLLSNQIDQNTCLVLYNIKFLILIITSLFSSRSPINPHPDIVAKYTVILTTVFNFITSTNDAMGNLIEVVQQDEKLMSALVNIELALKYFTSAISTDYFSKTNNQLVLMVYSQLPMCQGLSIEAQKQTVFDILLNRFLQDFKFFSSMPDPLCELINFISDFYLKSSRFDSSLSQNNQLLQSLLQRQFILEFPFELSSAKLYKALNVIYIKSIQTTEQMESFLSYFDQLFDQLQKCNHENGRMVFVLYSELNGVLKGNGNKSLYLFLFKWIMTHIDDTINCILKNVEDPIIRAISKVWIKIVTNKGIKLVPAGTSADAIQLFHCSLRVIQALISLQNPPFDIRPLIIKIIAPSVSGKVQINFGVMDYFKDTAFQEMISIFFLALNGWNIQNESSEADPKLINKIGSVIQAIFQLKPELITATEQVALISNFFMQALTANLKLCDIRDILFDSITKFMELFIQNGNTQGFEILRPHFVKILDLLITSKESITAQASKPWYYMLFFDRGWVEHVFEQICSLYDSGNAEEVRKLFQVTFFDIDMNQPKANSIAELRNNLTNIFKKNIMKYSPNVYDIEEFRQMSE